MKKEKRNIIQEGVSKIKNQSHSLYQIGDNYCGWVSPDNKLYTFNENHYDFLEKMLSTVSKMYNKTNALKDGWVRIILPNGSTFNEFAADGYNKKRVIDVTKLFSGYILSKANLITLSWEEGRFENVGWAGFTLPKDKNKFLYFVETGEKIEEGLNYVRNIIKEEIDKFLNKKTYCHGRKIDRSSYR